MGNYTKTKTFITRRTCVRYPNLELQRLRRALRFCLQIVEKIFQNHTILMGFFKEPHLGNKLDGNPAGIVPSWAGELYKNENVHNSTHLRPLPKSLTSALALSIVVLFTNRCQNLPKSINPNGVLRKIPSWE